jgi:hypothetical protein
VLGSYLIPRSICSLIPNPKFPDLEKHEALSSLSLTFNPNFNNSWAFSPLTETWHPISSFLLIPKDLIVYLAFEVTGFCPDKSFKTLIALVSLSPLAP